MLESFKVVCIPCKALYKCSALNTIPVYMEDSQKPRPMMISLVFAKCRYLIKLTWKLLHSALTGSLIVLQPRMHRKLCIGQAPPRPAYKFTALPRPPCWIWERGRCSGTDTKGREVKGRRKRKRREEKGGKMVKERRVKISYPYIQCFYRAAWNADAV